MKRYWLSFCDVDKPKGDQFLGASIVEAISFIQAIQIAHMMGCNPGGEILGHEIPNHFIISSEWMNRILNRAECEICDKEMSS